MIKIVVSRAKTYIYLFDDGGEEKKVKSTKKVHHKKRKLKSENYKNCLEAT